MIETQSGRVLKGTMTVTETHLVLGAGLIGGFHPVHVDQEYAKSRGLAGRILHGSITAAIMGAVVGRDVKVERGLVLEQCTRFKGPVYPGDTLTSTWVAGDPAASGSGSRSVLKLEGECRNQSGALVAEGHVLILAELARPD